MYIYFFHSVKSNTVQSWLPVSLARSLSRFFFIIWQKQIELKRHQDRTAI